MPSKKTINPDLVKERNGASFDVEEFAVWWHGGADKLNFKRDMDEQIFKDMKEDNTLLHYKSHDEIYEQSVQQAVEMAKKLQKLQQERNPGGNEIWPTQFIKPIAWSAIPGGNPLDVHYSMVVEALRTQSTEEQFEKFGKRAEKLEVCGAYAQTELGHGTFLRGLETRADYDRKTEEFILNTPTITAYKWWPGGLGHTANYCILVANLYIDDKPHGVQMFWVQIRDEETHMPLPGIDIGEIGKKIGFYGVNNGYLGLKNIRIPRDRMLMRNAKVLKDGTFIKSPVSVLTYFTMVKIRCSIARDSAILWTTGATIATRYSAVRRQSPINPEEPEPQIIDHVTQQLKLFPAIAASIGYYVASNELCQAYDNTLADIGRGEYARLPELHAVSCAMKALCSKDSSDGIEHLRLACGGHGYLTSSNMGILYAAATAAATYEGENTVLLLQVGRFLFKSWRAALAGEKLAPTVAYLSEVVRRPHFDKWTGSWENLKKAMQFVAANKTRLAFESFSERLKANLTEAEATNNTGIELVQAAELHGRTYVFESYIEEVVGPNAAKRSLELNKVLENLLELYLVHTTLRHLSDILRFIELSEANVKDLQTRLEAALSKIRPDAVAICDGFDYHDRSLSSTLGSYDGNVYERLFEAAKKSPLNRQPVPKAFHEHLKPFMKSNM